MKKIEFSRTSHFGILSTRTADAKKFISIVIFEKCIYLHLLKKLALYGNSLSRKKHFSDARGQNDPPPLVVLGLMKTLDHGQSAYLSLYEITNNSLSSLTLKPKNVNVE